MKELSAIHMHLEKRVSLRANPAKSGMSEAIPLHKAGVFNLTNDAFCEGIASSSKGLLAMTGGQDRGQGNQPVVDKALTRKLNLNHNGARGRTPSTK
jgi:hypothetical protein